MRRILLLLIALLCTGCGDPGTPPAPRRTEARAPLVLVLDVPKAEYAVNEDLVFGVEVANRGDAPLYLASLDDEMWWYAVRFESLDVGADFVGGNLELIDFEVPPDVVLEPGQAWRKELHLTEYGRFLCVVEDRRPGDDWDYRDRLPAGRYRATLTYENDVSGEHGAWTGRVESAPVEITIVPPR